MGIGFCLGFVLPPNFRAPFASIGFRDVWQRWHITLVAWMRDYVFNPLGGVYKGYLRAALNIMIVMLLIGLWHGATVPFLIFGFLHGIYLIGETLLQRTRLRRLRLWTMPLSKVLLWALTLILCLIAFVSYRATSLGQALWVLSAMFGRPHESYAIRLSETDFVIAAVVLDALIIAHWMCRNRGLEELVASLSWWAVPIGLGMMLIAITLSSADSHGYLYFRF
jgi:alginate O-acetyltransferase complex protein AlgI